MFRIVLPALLGLLLAASPTLARTWHITPDGSGDAPTIQAGIDSATAGDLVEVACGAYTEHDIILRSGVTLASATGQPECVTIDAQGLGRVLYCSDVDATTRIIGFTVTGGVADEGGGMACVHSAPILQDCAFVGNAASFDGGALDLKGQSSPEITRSSFSMNTAGNCGGAVSHENCTIEAAAPVFRVCEFSQNVAGNCGGGIGVGACVGGSLLVEDCVFRDNEAASGGGLYCWNESLGELIVRRSLFSGNSATSQGGGSYTGQGPSVSITECTFVGNSAYVGGGLRLVDAGGVESCTIAANDATTGGGVACHLPNDSQVSFANTVLWGNRADIGTELHYWSSSSAAMLTFSCCDVSQSPGWIATDGPGGLDLNDGTFSADPLFCDPDAGDFAIRSNSPCAPPGATGCGLIGSLPVGCGPVSVETESWGRIKGRYRIGDAAQ